MSDMHVRALGPEGWWRANFWHSKRQHGMNHMSDGARAVFTRSTERMDAIAENLANASTPGYRAGAVLPKNFVGELSGRLVGHQWRIGTDLTEGALRLTDRPLDFALQGDGFFVVRHGEYELLTRNGSFEVTPEGVLTTASGHVVLSAENGPIQLPPNTLMDRIEVSEDGVLRADGQELGAFRIERVDDERLLRRVGTTLFSTIPENRGPAEGARVIGRSLETSNTTVYQELADMMTLSRSFEATQKALSNEMQSQKNMMNALTA